MEVPGVQTWIVFYLISFVVLLWAAFLTATGVMLWVSLMLVIIVVGLNCYTVINHLEKHASRMEWQRSLTKDFDREKKDD
jgi:Flp pilus assembly protein TadB